MPAPDLAPHMQASFWMAVRARDALIEGDLLEAQRAADSLANHDYSQSLPADWNLSVIQLQQRARDLSLAPNLASASQELGRVALACGDCHDLHQRGPDRARKDPEPWQDPPGEPSDRVLRHQSGAEQIWNGLVMPSEQAFRSGTLSLSRAPLMPSQRGGAPIDSGLATLIEEVRELARRARASTSYDERGRVYGELIARCAGCHTYLR